jgi:RimJ/RimL family protein N-acetyltransferase
MITIRNSKFNELKILFAMGSQDHVGTFLSHKLLETHENDFAINNIIYLSIVSGPGLLAGYIILSKEDESKSVQFKRILIDEKHLGIGQEAILVMERYCVSELNISRIWLDVYENNAKAKYVYEKLGYKQFKEGTENSKAVLFYEKIF